MWLLLLAGCGRVAFEPLADDGGGSGFGFRSLCSYVRVLEIQDLIPADDAAGDAATGALISACNNNPPVMVLSQDAPGVLDPQTDRPLLAPDMVAVIGGGNGPQRAIAYLRANGSPVIWTDNSPITITERSTGDVVVTGEVSATHDYPILFAAPEPISGGAVLSVQGSVAEGTQAAGLWLMTAIEPQLATDPHAWIVGEWTDTDATAGPSAGDTYKLLATGP